VFRFDRQTKRYELFGGPESGLPVRGWSPWMKSDGQTVWVQHEQGTYVLDRKARRFRPVFATRNGTGSEDAPFGVVSAVEPDPSTPDAVFLLLSEPVRAVHTRDPQPPFLFRYRKSTARLEPLPVSPELLATLASPETPGVSYTRRPPGLRGAPGAGHGLLAEGSRLWVGTSAGLCTVDTRTGRWSLVPLPMGTPPFLIPMEIFCDSAGDGGGALRINTANGALRLARVSEVPAVGKEAKKEAKQQRR